MADRKDRIKLIVAVSILTVAAIVLAIQYYPRSSSPVVQQTAADPATDAKVTKSGAKVVRQGGRTSLEPPTRK